MPYSRIDLDWVKSNQVIFFSMVSNCWIKALFPLNLKLLPILVETIAIVLLLSSLLLSNLRCLVTVKISFLTLISKWIFLKNGLSFPIYSSLNFLFIWVLDDNQYSSWLSFKKRSRSSLVRTLTMFQKMKACGWSEKVMAN